MRVALVGGILQIAFYKKLVGLTIRLEDNRAKYQLLAIEGDADHLGKFEPGDDIVLYIEKVKKE